LRLRFEQRELDVLKGAEQVRGAAMAHGTRPDVLRTALGLAKVGHKVGSAVSGGQLTLDEGELGLLVDALRFANQEVQWAARRQAGEESRGDAARRQAVLAAFPELVDKGPWRSFGLSRELDALAGRLAAALKGG
jgi:hypothetical protein